MIYATLHESERVKAPDDIPEPRISQLRIVMKMNPNTGRADLPIHYVPDDRDLSSIEPIQCPAGHVLDRTILQPLLDALERGDIELASALAPEGKRLCGYNAISESFAYHGNGAYAEDHWTIQIEKGVYPIFAQEFSISEVKNAYTNQVKDFPGILHWYDGTTTESTLYPESVGEHRTLFDQEYGHQFAKGILTMSNSDLAPTSMHRAFLIHPFQAREIPFMYRGSSGKTYGIFDTTLPDFLPERINPIHLRSSKIGLIPDRPSLSSLITQAKYRADQKTGESRENINSHTR